VRRFEHIGLGPEISGDCVVDHVRRRLGFSSGRRITAKHLDVDHERGEDLMEEQRGIAYVVDLVDSTLRHEQRVPSHNLESFFAQGDLSPARDNHDHLVGAVTMERDPVASCHFLDDQAKILHRSSRAAWVGDETPARSGAVIVRVGDPRL
jgi:hypothetical protein